MVLVLCDGAKFDENKEYKKNKIKLNETQTSDIQTDNNGLKENTNEEKEEDEYGIEVPFSQRRIIFGG